jgi:hypothetical protein
MAPKTLHITGGKVMTIRNRILLAAVALSTAIVSLPTTARTFVEIQVAPPPPQVEVVPPPRLNYQWAPGYWRWNGRRHVWIRGVWVPVRRGFHWEPAVWVQGPSGRWHLVPGHWVR